MSLTISFLTFDVSIPILIHGLFTLIFLRRFFFDIFGKLLAPLPYQNPCVRLEIHSWKESIGFLRNLDESERIMESTCPRKSKTQETETNGAQIDPRKDQVLSTNSMDSASVQAKMSLDLIVEQLKREMSLKDMEDDKEQRSVLTNSTAMDNDAVESKDSFPIVLKEEITKIDFGEEKEEKEEKAGDGLVEMTDPIEVNVISMNLKKFEELEEKETKKEVGTILPREPVVKSYGREEDNLYGLIRSMIAAEVKRYEEREKKFLRKVHSDATDIAGRRMNKRMFLLFNNENSSNDIKEKKKKKKEEEINLAKIVKCINLKENNLTKNKVEKDKDVRLPWMSALEGKGFFDRAEGRKINEGENTLAKESENGEKESKDGATQTERAYTIRAAKSCPLRKRRIYEGVVSDARHKAELLERIHRKASDNLIYEKGKASGSPSYVPLTERFRWRYVRARKAR